MYADVKELHAGGAERLQAALRKSATEAAQSSSGRASHALLPISKFDSHGTESTRQPASKTTSQATGSTPTNPTTTNSSRKRSPQSPSNQMFLLLCVNTNRLKSLAQLKLEPGQDDKRFFELIRSEYVQLRSARKFHPDTPEFIRTLVISLEELNSGVQKRIIRFFNFLRINWLVSWLGDLVFYIPEVANFVEVCKSIRDA